MAPRRLIVIDSTGEKWVMGFTAQHQLQLQRYRITGWSTAHGA
ncbi:hypothetical protein [Streptomyces sp. XD-27]|nr:hypothetical protein [Streptomyces sp. XD-27]WKX69574.1 hypothetical protein Q3Y56_06310 [Streptomyces sp. XD-27]